MIVIVTEVHMVPGSTIATADGAREDGSPITIAGDWRPMRDLADAVAEHGPIEVEVEDWQVIG